MAGSRIAGYALRADVDVWMRGRRCVTTAAIDRDYCGTEMGRVGEEAGRK